MTALVGAFGAGAGETGSSRFLTATLSRMQNRGAAIPEQFQEPGALLASRRHGWEVDEHGWRGPVITVGDDWVVAADAALYYLDDLRRRLSPFHPVERAASSGELILASLRVWGDGFASVLEGDFAIVACHRPTGRVLLARDFAGRRNLAWSLTSDRTLIVASSPRAVVEHPGVSRELDRTFIASSISGLNGHGPRTPFTAVSVVAGGATLAVEKGQWRIVDQWLPPSFSSDWDDVPSDRAAERLRHVIETAVHERLPERGTAAIWMSGGWDSTSVYAAGRSVLERRRDKATTLAPVSMRYPEGDTGDEARFIDSISRHWNVGIRWIDVNDMRLFEDAARRASVRDDPRVSPFETQIRSMCRVTRELGARVALDGAGGDHLFTVSTAAVMADHLRSGRIAPLWREWRGWGSRHPWTFVRSVLLPQLSPAVLQWIGSVRGRPLSGFWDSAIPAWVHPSPDLLREAVPEDERDPDEGVAAWESRKVLTIPLVQRALSWNHAIALEEGVLLRSPLFDRRVIEFAASRPLNERLGGSDSKVLLRRAMKDLLPADVLEPRGRKTGTPVEYFRREMISHASAEFLHLFADRRSHLEALGIIDLEVLRKAIESYIDQPVHSLGAAIQLTMEGERWLAAQELEG